MNDVLFAAIYDFKQDCNSYDETALRTAMQNWATSFGQTEFVSFGKDVEITTVHHYNLLKLGVENLIEKRTIQTATVPYTGSELSHTVNYRDGQNIWDVKLDGGKKFAHSSVDYNIAGSDTVSSCSRCGGRGKDRCYHCDGSGRIPCPKCGGRARIMCPDCHGTGRWEYVRTGEPTSYKPCGACHGAKEVPCPTCMNGRFTGGAEPSDSRAGAGHVRCGDCGGSGEIVCSSCGGKGQMIRYSYISNVFDVETFEDSVLPKLKDTGVLGDEEFGKKWKSIGDYRFSGNPEKIPSNMVLPEIEEKFKALLEQSNKFDDDNSERKKASRIIVYGNDLVEIEYKYNGMNYLCYLFDNTFYAQKNPMVTLAKTKELTKNIKTTKTGLRISNFIFTIASLLFVALFAFNILEIMDTSSGINVDAILKSYVSTTFVVIFIILSIVVGYGAENYVSGIIFFLILLFGAMGLLYLISAIVSNIGNISTLVVTVLVFFIIRSIISYFCKKNIKSKQSELDSLSAENGITDEEPIMEDKSSQKAKSKNIKQGSKKSKKGLIITGVVLLASTVVFFFANSDARLMAIKKYLSTASISKINSTSKYDKIAGDYYISRIGDETDLPVSLGFKVQKDSKTGLIFRSYNYSKDTEMSDDFELYIDGDRYKLGSKEMSVTLDLMYSDGVFIGTIDFGEGAYSTTLSRIDK
ncbi:hypothetical protein FACS1894147_00960 [Spirochaetia bacterium]|nr:hypothetical protein FACS1894147_00960 [Spirochaetia bacterium]